MRYEIRPLGAWTGPATRNRPYCRFRASWSDTLNLLGWEADHLGARLLVLQVDVTLGEIRRDGMLRANARAGHPGVRVSFESRHGPLTYATDRYDRWQDNVRAIALSLGALRAVDRYGVSKSGEQYRGWTAISAGPAMTVEAAVQLLVAFGNGTPREIVTSAAARRLAYHAAIRKHHPDVGGDPDTFRRLTAARDLLDHTDGGRR